MKTIICGGKNYYLDYDDVIKLDHLKYKITQVISGGSGGVDSCGEIWAKKNNIPLKIFRSDWITHGKLAAQMRNKQMMSDADACILFPGGVETETILKLALEHKLDIYDYRLKS
jgi:hypothetical protein